MTYWISVALQTPAHSSVAGPLTYRSELPLTPGTLVRVPLGSREVLGIVWAVSAPPDGRTAETTRLIAGALEAFEPLSAPWLATRGLCGRVTTNAPWAKWRWPHCRRNFAI
jgi:primosomal protein N' (replication factor Y)